MNPDLLGIVGERTANIKKVYMLSPEEKQ